MKIVRYVSALLLLALVAGCSTGADQAPPRAAAPQAPAATPQAAAPAGPGGAAPGAGLPALSLKPVLEGLTRPLGLYHAGDGSGRLFLLEQGGVVRIARGGQLLSTPFLDISARVRSTSNEQGLLGLAFHPLFRENGILFLHYTGAGGETVLARFRVKPDRTDEADPASEEVFFTTPQPYPNHNGGAIAFGPDGYLYVALGDGGSAGDPGNRSQDLGSFLGKLLRIDVAQGPGYKVPAGNPFVGKAAKPEIWAYGLRNPWRIAFDRKTGDLWIADVGQNKWEEINFQPAASKGGENYGWKVLEGLETFSAGSLPGAVPPVAVYGRDLGCSVTGGHVYRGQAIPSLQGTYLYGDYCTGRVWGIRQEGGKWVSGQLLQQNLQITAFGEDEAGEIYLIHRGGTVYRLEGR